MSAPWSDAPARALIEFDRALLYLLALASVRLGAPNFGERPLDGPGVGARHRRRVRDRARDAGTSRCLADPETIANERLSYPLTYWNALGLIAAVGVDPLLPSRKQPKRAARSPGLGRRGCARCSRRRCSSRFRAARSPPASSGLPPICVLGRPRALLSGLLATGPATAIAVIVAYNADLLATSNPTSAAADGPGPRRGSRGRGSARRQRRSSVWHCLPGRAIARRRSARAVLGAPRRLPALRFSSPSWPCCWSWRCPGQSATSTTGS